MSDKKCHFYIPRDGDENLKSIVYFSSYYIRYTVKSLKIGFRKITRYLVTYTSISIIADVRSLFCEIINHATTLKTNKLFHRI